MVLLVVVFRCNFTWFTSHGLFTIEHARCISKFRDFDKYIISCYFLLKQTQIFRGNSDPNTLVTSLFASRVRAVFVRILPTDWQGPHPNMRFEILGCRGNYRQSSSFNLCFVVIPLVDYVYESIPYYSNMIVQGVPKKYTLICVTPCMAVAFISC